MAYEVFFDMSKMVADPLISNPYILPDVAFTLLYEVYDGIGVDTVSTISAVVLAQSGRTQTELAPTVVVANTSGNTYSFTCTVPLADFSNIKSLAFRMGIIGTLGNTYVVEEAFYVQS